jgi:hypothetical protein
MGIGGRMGEMAPRPCAALPAGDLPASGGGDGGRRRSGVPCGLYGGGVEQRPPSAPTGGTAGPADVDGPTAG